MKDMPFAVNWVIQKWSVPLQNELNGPTAGLFFEIWTTQSGAMVFILNLDKVLLKKLFPTMNI